MKALCEQYGYQTVLEAARKAQEQLREVLQTGRYTELRLEEDCRENCGGECSADVPKRMQESDCPMRQVRHQIIQNSSMLRAYLLEKSAGDFIPAGSAADAACDQCNGRDPAYQSWTCTFGRKAGSTELVPLMTGYTNLEMNLEDGKRGSRYDHFSENLCRLTGAEACLAVNNNAAAVLVMLTALASGGETIVSRGELVEIGGKFRIPDVCCQSGTTLVEVGTTNRTYLEDYQNAVTENTAAFLKVHTSNYQITGFTHEPTVEELAQGSPQPRNPPSGGPWKRMPCRYGSLWFAV